MVSLTLTQHHCSRGAAITDDLAAKCLFENPDHVRRKSIGIQRPGSIRNTAGHFPIAGYGIHALRKKSKTAETSLRLPHRPNTFDLCNVAESERFQRGKTKSPNSIGQMRQGMGTGVTVFRRIGHGPNAESIHHQHDDTTNHGRTIAEARCIGNAGMARDKREKRD